MEPLTPEKRDEILRNLPKSATEADYREYEQLVAKRFSQDPSLAGGPDKDEARLKELMAKLFGAAPRI